VRPAFPCDDRIPWDPVIGFDSISYHTRVPCLYMYMRIALTLFNTLSPGPIRFHGITSLGPYLDSASAALAASLPAAPRAVLAAPVPMVGTIPSPLLPLDMVLVMTLALPS